MSQSIRIEPAIFALFPDVHIGVIVCEGLNNRDSSPETIASLNDIIAGLPQRIEQDLNGNDLATHPHIAPWRDAYRKFGAKPSKYLSSIENLVKRIIKGYVPSAINPLVDVYNTISLKYLLPVGGEDIAQTQGDILLTVAGDDELAIHLLGEAEARPPDAGEVIYKDDNGAICRRWNWKEAERTKLTEDTTRAILVIEAVPPIDVAILTEALTELEGMVQSVLGAKTRSAILNQANPTMTLTLNG